MWRPRMDSIRWDAKPNPTGSTFRTCFDRKGKLMSKTPMRSFRINDEIYAQAKARAEQEGLTLTDVIVGSLEMFVDGTIDPELLKSK